MQRGSPSGFVEEDDEALDALMASLASSDANPQPMTPHGPGGSNTGLDAAYDAGRIITVDAGKIVVQGNGLLGFELQETPLLVRDGVGGSPAFMLQTFGASPLQAWLMKQDAATGTMGLESSRF